MTSPRSTPDCHDSASGRLAIGVLGNAVVLTAPHHVRSGGCEHALRSWTGHARVPQRALGSTRPHGLPGEIAYGAATSLNPWCRSRPNAHWRRSGGHRGRNGRAGLCGTGAIFQ